VNCPECQKPFRVRVEDLSSGFVRFQCTGCHCVFGFDWPQPPGVEHIRAMPANPDQKPIEFIKAESPPDALPTIATVSLPLRSCPRCQTKSPDEFKECPRCGVIFEKLVKLKPEIPEVRAGGPEIVVRWEQVKKNYSNLFEHEEFIQICLSKNNLHYASSQYRSVLSGNPNEEIARKMQARILELATGAYLSHAQVKKESDNLDFNSLTSNRARRSMLTVTNIFMALAFAMIIAGVFINPMRGLIAVGISILVFVFSLKYFSQSGA
jgi:hypothetical protein